MTRLVEEEKAFNELSRLDELKWRVKHCCCKYCGSPLKLRRILYGNNPQGRIEIFCQSCGRIEYGVEPEIYGAAKYFVEETRFNNFPDNADSEETQQMNIAKVCDILAWGCKSLGFLSNKGFLVPPDISQTVLGEMVIFRDEDLPDGDIELLDLGVNLWER